MAASESLHDYLQEKWFFAWCAYVMFQWKHSENVDIPWYWGLNPETRYTPSLWKYQLGICFKLCVSI